MPLTIPIAEIEIDNLVKPSSLVNQNILFSVVTDTGEDVTSSTIFYVNDEPITWSSFSSDTTEEFEVYAIYNDILRHSFIGELGNAISETEMLTEYISSYTFNIPSELYY